MPLQEPGSRRSNQASGERERITRSAGAVVSVLAARRELMDRRLTARIQTPSWRVRQRHNRADSKAASAEDSIFPR